MKRLLKGLAKRVIPGQYYRRLVANTEVRTHWIPPDEVLFFARGLPRILDGRERIVGGNWDRSSPRFDEYDMVAALRAVLEHGQRWEEQPFYARVVARLRGGEPMWGCRNDEEFSSRLDSIRRLYTEIGSYGYFASHNHDEIMVAVGRDGDLFLYDGAHRLAIARLLRLPSIPVRIVARHPEWVRFKTYIMEHAATHRRGTYQPCLHPDLEWISAYHGHQRWELIKRAVGVQSGRVLDIGCNWGYFCHQFEVSGFECVGVEQDPGDHYILERLKRAQRRHFSTYCGSIFDYAVNNELKFDVVLALAIFHHLIKTEETRDQLRDFLRRLTAAEMYFIPHQSSEGKVEHAYWNPNEEEFLRFVMEAARFKDSQVLGHTEDGRRVFKLHR